MLRCQAPVLRRLGRLTSTSVRKVLLAVLDVSMSESWNAQVLSARWFRAAAPAGASFVYGNILLKSIVEFGCDRGRSSSQSHTHTHALAARRPLAHAFVTLCVSLQGHD